MEKFFNGVLKFLAAICAILFVFSTAVALLLFNAERRLFNANLYLRAFESQDLYERLPELAAEMLTSAINLNPCDANPVMCASEGRPSEAQACLEAALGAETYETLVRNKRTPTPEEVQAIQPCLDQYPQDPGEQATQGGPPEYMTSLSTEDWQAIIGAVLPPEMLRPLTEQALTSVFGYLDGQADSAVLSLVEFKAHLGGPAGFEAVMLMLHAQPPCTPEQIVELTAGNLSGEPELILCNPSDEILEFVQPLVESQLQLVVASLPDEAVLIPADAPGMENPLQALRALRIIMRFSPLLPLGLLFLITVFAVRSLKGWLDWWGAPLFLGGLTGLVGAASINPIYKWAFNNTIQPGFPPGLPVSFAETARGILGSVLSGVAAPIIFQSIALLLLGIILVLATRIKRPARIKPKPQDIEGEIPDERS